jgi:hypothetical protein
VAALAPFAPLAQGRGGGGGDGAWGGRESARRLAANKRGDARRGDGRGRGGGCTDGGNDIRRAPEEKEKAIFHPEVSGRFPSSMFLDWPGPKVSCLRVRRVASAVPPLAPAKVLRTDAVVPTRRRSSRASQTAVSSMTAATSGSRDAAGPSEPQPVATNLEPLPVAAEAQQAATATDLPQPATTVEPQQPAAEAGP